MKDDLDKLIANAIIHDPEFAQLIEHRLIGDQPIDLRGHDVTVRSATNGYIIDGCTDGMSNEVREQYVFEAGDDDHAKDAGAVVALVWTLLEMLDVDDRTRELLTIGTRADATEEIARDLQWYFEHEGYDPNDADKWTAAIEYVRGVE